MVAVIALIVDEFVLSAYKSRGLRKVFGIHELDVLLKHRTVLIFVSLSSGDFNSTVNTLADYSIRSMGGDMIIS